VWVLDETILVRDEQGTPLWVQGFLVDITERKNAEETRARLASIIESSNEAITSASLDLRFTSWNAGAERMFGYPAKEVLGQPVTLLVPPEHQQRALDLVRRVVEEDQVAQYETVRLREDGARVHVSFTYSPIRNSSGKVVGVSAIGQDVTERKRAEQAIRDSESKFRAFVETTDEWVWAMDVDTMHTYSNPAVTRILGYEPEEVVGMAWSEFVVEADREELVRAIAEQAERREGWSAMVVRCLHRDGSMRFLESTATPDLDDEGVLIGWRGTDRDVTGRIQAEADRERLLVGEQEARAIAEAAQRDLAAQNERLRELDRLKDEFIALVSHELRTPLTSIRGYTELLLDGEAGELTEDQRQFLGVVERNSHRLLHLVGDLLFLAQVEAGKLVLDVGALDLSTVASESVETARPQAEAKGITLTLATGPTPPVAGDRARIGQLLDNLVSNAIKFTPEGGRVDVRVRVLRKQAILEVRDSGMGIPAIEQEFLFERFFRTSTATEQAIQGTGLGLAISKAIVEAHEGRITVASEEGAGTTFRVSLPLHRHAEVCERSEVAL
jgi:PAS domain S-box-containing protein